MTEARLAHVDTLEPIDRELLDAVQHEFPLAARPFAAIGRRLGLAEDDVIAHVRRLKDDGLIRQIGAIFDTRALGYRSTLVAMRVPLERVEQAAAAVSRHPGVSHNYRRDHAWNLWFTLAVPPEEDLEGTVAHLAEEVGGYPYRSLPALRVFKIGVRLAMSNEGAAPRAEGLMAASPPRPLSPRDRAFVCALQGDIEIVAQPFGAAAGRLSVSQDEIFIWLRQAAAAGWLRRFAAILSHHRAGYGANGMVVWRVPPQRLVEAAAVASSFPQVSHCYQRPTFPDWPYALFTMIHARSEEECRAVAEDISSRIGVGDYAILFSTREYKKERVRYFEQNRPMECKTSGQLFAEAQRYIPGGVNSPVRAFRAVGGEPLLIARGEGPHLYDVDGRRYIDYVLSWGPLILGHAHPAVVNALTEAAQRGTSYGAPTELETELARLVVEAVPSIEMVRFVNSGTEATMSALRLARAYTGRDKIIKFDGCYHGHADSLLVRAGSGVATLGLPDSPGVPLGAAEDTLVASYNDLESAQRLFEANRGQIAAIIVEPVAANFGVIPPRPGFLVGLRQLAHQDGALLILDEVITGFRLAYGGAQTLYGVLPDLTCLGKVIGGGLPVGAYGGRREVMEMVAPLGPVYQAGTLAGNPLAMTAGIETLRELIRPGVYETLEQRSAWLAEGIGAAARAAGVPVCQTRVGSLSCTFFTDQPVSDVTSARSSDTARYARFFRSMLTKGVYLAPSQFEAAFLSLAHGEEELDHTVRAAEEALADLAP